ncbi:glycoside hydrolase [Cylindrobasidium torrendii FP15055 ss-10]|uniref:Glycoside hydrolase n=1 Tax=Cylindrobasidium torrendii FP15055 ss-10 TaxID=1314674 RepID=A0A0D7BCD1_9AGAR|nr:glycoside hydrolase [Cylindrobasidium torrendii FP15055 ss-10]
MASVLSLVFATFFVSQPVFAASPTAAAWYAGWHAAQFPPANVSWSKYSLVTYAFALPSPDAGKIELPSDDEDAIVREFVQEAHKNNVKASISIGGWTGSRYFSSQVGSAHNRTAFVDGVLDLVSEYSFDGVDFDWEYPNKQGVGCNIVNKNDSANFLSFLQELRGRPAAKDLVLSAATFLQPFNGSDGKPMQDVSAFGDVLDHIAIMNYDVSNALSVNAGPNAPLNDTCAPANHRHGSAATAVAAWTSAGMPSSKILLGVPAYGHSFAVGPLSNSSELSAYPASNPSVLGKGDSWDGDGGEDICGVFQGPSGVYNYWALAEEGLIDKNGTALSGVLSSFDNCSQTPYVYDRTKQVLISYDNPVSFAAKGRFIRDNALAGFAVWEAAGDPDDILLDAILSGISDTTSTSQSPSASASSTPSNAVTPRHTTAASLLWASLPLHLILTFIL